MILKRTEPMKPTALSRIVFLFIALCAPLYCLAAEDNPAKPVIPELTGRTVLDLKTAGAIALRQNPSIAMAASRVKQSLARLSQARSAFWPRIDLTGAYSEMEMSDKDYEDNLTNARFFDPTATIENPDDYYQAGARATWVLFNGFERKYLNRAVRYGKEQSELMKDDTERLILSAVANAYYAAQLAKEAIIINRADKEFNERLLSEAKARSKLGAGSLSDEMNFEIRAKSAQAKLLRAKTDYRTAMVALATIMGVPEATLPKGLKLASLASETSADDGSPFIEGNSKSDHTKELIDVALANRADIKAATAALKAAEATVKQAWSAFYPDVSLYASIDGDRTGDSSMESEDFGNSVGATLSYNLFAGGADWAGVRKAKAKKTEARKNMEKLRVDITAEVRNAVDNLDLAKQELSIQRTIADLVRKNRDLVKKEYSAGQSSLVRLNEAQRDMTSAQGQLALALVSFHQARFDLESALGTIQNQF